jgi:hypothetical protein
MLPTAGRAVVAEIVFTSNGHALFPQAQTLVFGETL